MLKVGQDYYCETKEDVDLIMDWFEKNNYIWKSGKPPRSQYQDAPIIYAICSHNKFMCTTDPCYDSIADSIHVKNIRNKIISDLRR